MDTTAGRRKVLHLTGSHAFYGAEQAIANLASHVDASRWEPVVGCLLDQRGPSSRMLDEVRRRGIRTFEVHLRRRVDLRGVRQLRAFLAAEQPAVLHCHGYKADGYGLLAARGLPVVRIATAHGWTRQTRAVSAYEWLDKRAFLPRYHRVIAVSEPIREELLRVGVEPARLVLIPNGVDLSGFPMRERRACGLLPFSPDDEVIGSVGRLSPEKGHAHLLDAMPLILRQRPRARLVLVGGGPEEAALREKAREMGLENKVIFAGVRDDVPALLAHFDVFALPSLTEGLPISVLEAMAVGVPVAATRVGDVPEVVRHKQTGLLAPARDPAALAAAVLELLDQPERARSMARAARALVEQEYSAGAMAARTAAVYEEALSSTCAAAEKA